MPDHHLPDDLLLDYATGGASEAHALVCALHLTLCEACRHELEVLEQLGGVLLEGDALGPGDDPPRPLEEAPAPLAATGPLPPGAEAWPRPLHPYVRGRAFRWHAPGIHVLTTALVVGAMPVRVVRMAGGVRIDEHTHRGAETLLVLTGGFVDRGLARRPGDVVIADDEVEHAIEVDDDGPCDALVVNEHPLVPLTLRGRLFARLRSS